MKNKSHVLKTDLMWRISMLTLVLLAPSTVFAKKVEYRKSQTVNFEQQDVDGRATTPNGSFVVNKLGLSLVPLYKVPKNFDENIKESVEFVK